MTLTSIWSLVTKILDICIVWLLFYYILKNIKNNIKMVLIVKGVIIILAVKLLSDWLNLYTVGVILEYAIQWGPLAIIVILGLIALAAIPNISKQVKESEKQEQTVLDKK